MENWCKSSIFLPQEVLTDRKMSVMVRSRSDIGRKKSGKFGNRSGTGRNRSEAGLGLSYVPLKVTDNSYTGLAWVHVCCSSRPIFLRLEELSNESVQVF